jgi:hypothetical protein
MFSFISTCVVKSKYIFIKNVFGSKDWVERRKVRESALLMGKLSSNYMRVCRKHSKKKTTYICKLNSILRLYRVYEKSLVLKLPYFVSDFNK